MPIACCSVVLISSSCKEREWVAMAVVCSYFVSLSLYLYVCNNIKYYNEGMKWWRNNATTKSRREKRFCCLFVDPIGGPYDLGMMQSVVSDTYVLCILLCESTVASVLLLWIPLEYHSWYSGYFCSQPLQALKKKEGVFFAVRGQTSKLKKSIPGETLMEFKYTTSDSLI